MRGHRAIGRRIGDLAKSETTKAALLDAAQAIFASQGIDGASLRAIQRLAGVTPGTLQYHFDSREELLEALLAREHAGLNAKVSRLALRLRDQEQTPDARAIVAVLAEPYLEFVNADPVRGPNYLKVLAQLARKDDPRIAPLIGEIKTLFPELMARAYPGATRAQADTAIATAARALLFLLAGQALDAGAQAPADGAGQADTIVSFVAGGLDALLSRPGSQEGQEYRP